MMRCEWKANHHAVRVLRKSIRSLGFKGDMADSRTVRQMEGDMDEAIRLRQKADAIGSYIYPKGRDVMRQVYLARKLERVYLLRARAGREKDSAAFGRYHRMIHDIQKEIRRG